MSSYERKRFRERPPRSFVPYLIILAVLVVAGLALLPLYLQTYVHHYEDTVVPPTCQAGGYTVHTCRDCGDSYTDTPTEPLAHQFGPARVIRAATVTTTGMKQSTCTLCGAVLQETIPVVSPAFPTIWITEEGTPISAATRDSAVPVKITYSGNGHAFVTYATLRVQGFTSALFPKKNYNVKLFDDKAMTTHAKVDTGYGAWGAQWRYTLKANWVDRSHARNIVSCRIWSQMVASRSNSDENLLAAPNNGCTDGFPVEVYVGGQYYGLYTLNIPKAKWMFGIDEEQHPRSAIITSQMHNGTNRFQATTNLWDTKDWEVEYCSTGEDITWLNESFNRLLTFVSTKSGSDFRAGIRQYMDVDAVIDYAIMCYLMYGPDNWDKNMVLVTYDGVKWIPCLYDADYSFGLHWDGSYFYDYESIDRTVPGNLTEKNMTGTSNWLLTKVLYNFKSEFRARYRSLRRTVLSEANLTKLFSDFTGGIPAAVYARDREKWHLPDPYDATANAKNDIAQMRYFIRRRLPLLDQAMNALT